MSKILYIFSHVFSICDKTGNVKSRGMPCERQRHAERRDQILTTLFYCAKPMVIISTSMDQQRRELADQIGHFLMTACLVAIAVLVLLTVFRVIHCKHTACETLNPNAETVEFLNDSA